MSRRSDSNHMRLPHPIDRVPPQCWVFVVAALTSACTAELDGGAGGPRAGSPSQMGATPDVLPDGTQGGPVPTDQDAVASACKAKAGVLDTGRTPLRRLTRAELDHSVRALLQVERQPSPA